MFECFMHYLREILISVCGTLTTSSVLGVMIKWYLNANETQLLYCNETNLYETTSFCTFKKHIKYSKKYQIVYHCHKPSSEEVNFDF